MLSAQAAAEEMKQLEIEKIKSEIAYNNARAENMIASAKAQDLDSEMEASGYKHSQAMERQKAQAQGNRLNLAVGYSHPVNKDMPDGIVVTTPTPTEVLIKGADRQRVGQIAAEIRAIRPPEPYKGKGIRYSEEKVAIKETKKK